MIQQKLRDAVAPSDEEYRVEALHSTIHAKNSNNQNHDMQYYVQYLSNKVE